jgi:hypothetical protein
MGSILEMISAFFRWLIGINTRTIIKIILILFGSAFFILLLDALGLIDLHNISFLRPYNLGVTWAIEESIENNKPYAVQSIVEDIRIEDVKNDSVSKRQANVRITYTIKLLRNITNSEKVFTEMYSSHLATEIQQWTGSEKEKSSDGAEYYVSISGKKGDVKSITTGANYFYSVPLNHTDLGCFNKRIQINPDEWLWTYTNDPSSDYIDDYTMLVESDNVNLSVPIDQSIYRIDTANRVIDAEDEARLNKRDGQARFTVVGKWHRISPGECIGLKIRWSLP